MSSFRLLDLPDELLEPIMEDAVPSAMGSEEEYDERCRTLLAVALTSKRLHSLALPLLYRVLRVTNSRFGPIMAACRDTDTPAYRSARTLVCDGEEFGGLAADLLSFAVAAAPRVSDLRVYYCEKFALTELQALHDLSSLTLHDIFDSTALHPEHVQSLRLLHVVDLSLDYLSFTRTGCEAFLSSATLPSLKHLSLGSVELDKAEFPTETPEELVPFVCPPLALLLRAKKFPNPGASRDRNRLVNAKGALQQMAASLSRVPDGAKPPLKLILLESALLTGHNVLAELKPAMDAFLEACKEVGVEVIVQQTPQYGFELWSRSGSFVGAMRGTGQSRMLLAYAGGS
ncbi:hypothetical protein JCM10213_008945 [Rhodosporidiobolus nylandii]